MEFWKFIKQYAEADVSADFVLEGGAGMRNSWHTWNFVKMAQAGMCEQRRRGGTCLAGYGD